jgi:hypothetical protein
MPGAALLKCDVPSVYRAAHSIKAFATKYPGKELPGSMVPHLCANLPINWHVPSDQGNRCKKAETFLRLLCGLGIIKVLLPKVWIGPGHPVDSPVPQFRLRKAAIQHPATQATDQWHGDGLRRCSSYKPLGCNKIVAWVGTHWQFPPGATRHLFLCTWEKRLDSLDEEIVCQAVGYFRTAARIDRPQHVTSDKGIKTKGVKSRVGRPQGVHAKRPYVDEDRGVQTADKKPYYDHERGVQTRQIATLDDLIRRVENAEPSAWLESRKG